MADYGNGGVLVNASQNYVNSYTGETQAFDAVNTMTPQMKTYYNTEALENARAQLRYAMFGKRQPLPANHGTTVEWRKRNTFGDVGMLTEGVIPVGKKFGYSAITADVYEYGDYAALTQRLKTHAVDNVMLDMTEELSAAGANTMDKLVRDTLMEGTAVIYAPNAETGDEVTSRYDLNEKCVLTPDLVAKARTELVKKNAPTIDGDYVCILHPSVAYSLRKASDWLDAHKYANPEAIYNGEIGKLHGVRFVETTNAKMFHNAGTGVTVYACLFLGKDAYGIIDPEAGGMRMIHKTEAEVGGPLEQFGTVGVKFETGCKILYEDRMVRVECGSEYSRVDKPDDFEEGGAV